LSPAGRALRIAFGSPEDFQREYLANLVNGGAFVATREDLPLRERVRVELLLSFCDRRLVLEGEVVHRVTPEMAQMGAPPGVAIQFDGPAHHVRAQLEPLRSASGAEPHRPPDSGRRRAPRTKARVPARLDGVTAELRGTTRDLSQTGALVSVPGEGVSVGDRVRLALTHPTSGEAMEVDGIVVREVRGEGGVAAVAVEFAPRESEREGMQRFVEGLQAVEHTRRLGGINGEIGELGVGDLLQMFASTGHAGTLALRRGPEDGAIGFERGVLRFVRLGPVTGMKALVRLCAWKDGSFEFHARLDPVEAPEAPLPFEAALFDAMRMLDEMGRIDRRLYPPDAVPRVARRAADAAELSKTEAAVLDLARAGFTVRRIVDVIPDPDPEIYRAFESLRERRALAF
jgi:Tfp pilus assembly protein PilZ